jgi:hypothetical protein
MKSHETLESFPPRIVVGFWSSEVMARWGLGLLLLAVAAEAQAAPFLFVNSSSKTAQVELLIDLL